MKKVLLTLLAVIVIVGALAGVGYTGYRVGYNQGAISSGNAPFIGRSERMNPQFMPHFNREFGLRTTPFHSPMMGRSDFGYNIFAPLRLLWNVGILALVVWFIYWLFTKSGWQVTRKTQDTPSQTEGN